MRKIIFVRPKKLASDPLAMPVGPESTFVIEDKPTKPPKRKRSPETLKLSGTLQWGRWSSLVKGIAERKGLKTAEAPESNRFDMFIENEWRITVIGMVNKEFCVNAYFNYDVPKHNMTMIKFEHIYFDDLINVIEAQLNNVKTFQKGEIKC